MVLACRNVEKGAKLQSEFEKEATRLGIAKISTEVARLDVSDLASIKSFATDWRTKKRPLHVLINNAGIFDIGGAVRLWVFALSSTVLQ